MSVATYAELLRNRQVQAVVGSSVLAGLSVGVALPIVLLVQGETGSFAAAGAVTAALAIASGVSFPLRGRVIDSFGQTRPLRWMALISALALVGLVVAALGGAPLGVLIAFAAAAGISHAPLLSSTRVLWADLVDHPDQLVGAYALQALLLEVFFIAGPLIAALLIAVASPAAAVIAVALAEMIGVLLLAATPASRAWRAEPRTVGAAGAMASRGMRTLVAIDIPFGALFGVLDVAVPAFAKAHDATAAAGVVLAMLAVGSMIGGLIYGARARRPTAARYALLIGALTLLTLPLTLAPSMSALAVLMGVAGLLVAPSVSVGLALIDDVAPAGTAAEATAWIGAAYQGGLAIGTAVAGGIVNDTGTDAVFLLASACAALAAALAVVGRRRIAQGA